MGHHISKQQSQQMSDDQQMMSSIEQHSKRSTTAEDLQVKSRKNRQAAAINVKKLKKEQNQRCDVNNSNIRRSSSNNNSSNSNSHHIKAIAQTKSVASTSTVNQDRSAGSVVITIRLLKMESARSFDGANVVGHDEAQNDNYSNNQHNNNNINYSSSARPAAAVQHSERNNTAAAAATARDYTHTYVNLQENSNQNQMNSFSVDNNNVVLNRSEFGATSTTANVNCIGGGNGGVSGSVSGGRVKENSVSTTINNLMIYESSGQNERNSIKNQNVNCALRSEASICDKNQANCTSQSEQPSLNAVNCLAHPLNTITLTDATRSSSFSSPLSLSFSSAAKLSSSETNQSLLSHDTQPKRVQDSSSAFIPSSFIGTVSPYPHHIPIANLIRPDYLNAVADEHCQNAKSDGSCCEKHNGTVKDSKELKTKKPNWGIKLNCAKLKGIKSLSSTFSQEPISTTTAAATTTTQPSSTYLAMQASNSGNSNAETQNRTKQTSAPVSGQPSTALLLDKTPWFSANGGNVIVVTMDQTQEPWFSDEYSIEDCDKKARLQRAIEIAEGVEPPPGFISSSLQSLNSMSSSNLQLIPNTMAGTGQMDANNKVTASNPHVNTSQWLVANVCSNTSLRFILQHADDMPRIHSQVDYIHCLVPDLKQITNCSFYWGKMDRYEAERLLENKPEGTFLLRDSAQEEFLFSVSFRKYDRSLHARIEQFNHKFSFDCHDPGVYTSKTVTGLLEHYKDPACVMFFEPALTLPLNRNFVFSLQQLCRATIVSHTTYDGINEICLPKKLKSYLKEYHYKQRVRVKKFDDPIYSTT